MRKRGIAVFCRIGEAKKPGPRVTLGDYFPRIFGKQQDEDHRVVWCRDNRKNIRIIRGMEIVSMELWELLLDWNAGRSDKSWLDMLVMFGKGFSLSTKKRVSLEVSSKRLRPRALGEEQGR